MPKINVYLPDELAEAVKEAGVPVSAVCQRALEQAVRRVTAIRETALGELDARMPHLTARARAALKLGIEQAQTEQAQTEQAAAVTTSHVLAGMLAEGGNLALHVLQAIEIAPEQLARELARQPSAEIVVAGDGSRRFSGPAANALEMAVTEATALGHNYVGCEHLLLGLVAVEDGLASQVLRRMGVELRTTRRAVSTALQGFIHASEQHATQAAPDTISEVLRRIEAIEQRLADDDHPA
jgi:ATP-dependent Clp protease ATP-binding subunit ClpA